MSSASSFAARFLQLMGDAGWRIALHVLPYAVASGVITEGALRLRLAIPWKLPLFALALASLHLAVMLGVHVATLRVSAWDGQSMAPARHVMRMAGRLTAEAATAGLVALLAALALVGALDLVISAADPAATDRWPPMALRAIATLAALSIIIILLAAATALSAATFGRADGLGEAVRRLIGRSERTTLVTCTAIMAGTLMAIAGTRLAGMADLGPPIIAAALGKALGYLGLVIPLSVGAALLAAEH